MDIERYNSLEPKAFFYWFRIISDIPRETGHEDGIVEFLQGFAAERSIDFETDEYGNTLFRLVAASGYENYPSILLQAHLDMVCNKDPGVDFDFSKEPIRFKFDGNDIVGDGTTLGADNGIGVAFMLAVADNPKLHKIPLELLFTVQEEGGLRGIRNYDFSRIKSKRMINFDSGYSHVMCVGSAGSVKSNIVAAYDDIDDAPGIDYILSITGGTGGHSGIMINKGRMCAINSMADILNGISENCSFRICGITSHKTGGNIVTSMECRIKSKNHNIEEQALKYWELVKRQYASTDPHLTFLVKKADDIKKCISDIDTRTVIDAMMFFRTGLRRIDHNRTDVTITSGCCSSAELENGFFKLSYNIRSSDNDERVFVRNQTKRLADLLSMKCEILDEYAGWKYVEGSAIQNKLRECYRKVTGKEINVEFVHGGIEVGPIVGAIPEMDAVGYAPTGIYAHTTKERLVTSDVPIFWDVMIEMLK